MTQIKGTNVLAPVVPFDTTDTHASHEAKYGKGGYRSVADATERDGIPQPRREAGMLVLTLSDGKVWKLASDLATWSEFASSSTDPRWDLFLPPAPGGLTAQARNASSVLVWDPPSVSDQTPIISYRVQASTGGAWSTLQTVAASTRSLSIGGLTNGTPYRFRVSASNAVGEGAYSQTTTTIIPATQPVDPLFSAVKVLLHMDGPGGAFNDSSPIGQTISANGSVSQTTSQSVFGGRSARFDNGCLSIPSVTLAADFTAEMWVRFGALSEYAVLLAGDTTNVQLFATTNQDGHGLRVGLTGVDEFARTSIHWQLNRWYFVSISRYAGFFTVYVDGVDVTESRTESHDVFSGRMFVGGGVVGGFGVQGYLDDLRITAGYVRNPAVQTLAHPDQ